MKSSMNDHIRNLTFAAAMTVGVAGCADNLHHRDTLSTHAGDAQAANIALMTIDPWPADASVTHIDGNGERGAAAIKSYRKNTSSSPATSTPVAVTTTTGS